MPYKSQSHPTTVGRIRISNSLCVLLLVLVLLAGQGATPARATGTIRFVVVSGMTVGPCGGFGYWAYSCDLQTALSVALPGDELWVRQGTYTPGSLRSDTFALKSGVSVYGGFHGDEVTRGQRDPVTWVTTLSGDIGDVGNDGDNVYHVLTGSGTDNTALLDGFIVTAGRATGSDSPDNLGGGMYNEGGSPMLTDVTFSGNGAMGGGGAIYNTLGSSPVLDHVAFNSNWTLGNGGGIYNDAGSSPTVTGVTTFTGNSALRGGGMANAGGSNPTLTHVTFNGNWVTGTSGAGGGMFNTGSSPTLTDVTFSLNTSHGSYGGGMYSESGSGPTLTNVTFDRNLADLLGSGAGMANDTSNPTLTNVIFSGNRAGGNGGGMYNHSCIIPTSGPTLCPTLTDVTFSANTATVAGYGGGYGGGMYNSDSSPIVAKVTFAGNSAVSGGGMYNYAGSSPTVTNATFHGNSATSDGGGMHNNLFSSPTVTNATFYGNSAASLGNGIYSEESSRPEIYDSIFWNEAGLEIVNASQAHVTLTDFILAGSCPSPPDCTNQIHSDPLLGALGDNGGFTQTMALGVGSSAIDAGEANSTCADTDQRGVPRPQGPHCDIGAYELRQYKISGTAGTGSATLSYTGGSTSADVQGHYFFYVLGGWTDTVTPSKTGYIFAPPSRPYTDVHEDWDHQDYTATLIRYTISGNAGIGEAVLSYDDGGSQTVTADVNGDYTLTVPYGWSGTVLPAKPGYTFTPDRRDYSAVTSDQAGENYTAIPLAAPVPRIYPPSGEVACLRPQVGADLMLTDIMRKNGSFDPSTITLTLDGLDIIGSASILQTETYPASEASVLYTPDSDLALGPHLVVLTYPTATGLATLIWDFTVASILCPTGGGHSPVEESTPDPGSANTPQSDFGGIESP